MATRLLAALACAAALASRAAPTRARSPACSDPRADCEPRPAPRASRRAAADQPRAAGGGRGGLDQRRRAATVTVRFAVHAVRRIRGRHRARLVGHPAGQRPGFEPGDDAAVGDRSRADPAAGRRVRPRRCSTRPAQRAYRPLQPPVPPARSTTASAPPLWLLQQTLRFGETRLLQVAFPPLPAALGVRRRQPAHRRRRSCTCRSPRRPGADRPAGRPTWPAPARPAPGELRADQFRYPDEPARRQSVRVDRVVAAPGGPRSSGPLRSLDDQDSASACARSARRRRAPAARGRRRGQHQPGQRSPAPAGRPRGRERSRRAGSTDDLTASRATSACAPSSACGPARCATPAAAAQVAGHYPALPAGTRTGRRRAARRRRASAACRSRRADGRRGRARAVPPVPRPTGRWPYASTTRRRGLVHRATGPPPCPTRSQLGDVPRHCEKHRISPAADRLTRPRADGAGRARGGPPKGTASRRAACCGAGLRSPCRPCRRRRRRRHGEPSPACRR